MTWGRYRANLNGKLNWPTQIGFVAQGHRLLGQVALAQYAPGLMIDHVFWIKRSDHSVPLTILLTGSETQLEFVEEVGGEMVGGLDTGAAVDHDRMLRDVNAWSIEWPRDV